MFEVFASRLSSYQHALGLVTNPQTGGFADRIAHGNLDI